MTRRKHKGARSGDREIIIKTADEIARMRRAGQVVALTLERLAQAAKPGVTTGELDRIGEATIRSFGAVPSFHKLYGYPANICASINDEVVHGIPGERALREGDIISFDVGATVDGMMADGAATYGVGEISEQAARLIRVTREALSEGVRQAVPGNRVADISKAVQRYVESHGCSVVRRLVGHGVGKAMHEAPQIPNFVNASAPGLEVLAPGMTLAIEPMVNLGAYDVVQDPDGWTFRTKDGTLSAHFEHTVVITERGHEVLTQRQAPDRAEAAGGSNG